MFGKVALQLGFHLCMVLKGHRGVKAPACRGVAATDCRALILGEHARSTERSRVGLVKGWRATLVRGGEGKHANVACGASRLPHVGVPWRRIAGP